MLETAYLKIQADHSGRRSLQDGRKLSQSGRRLPQDGRRLIQDGSKLRQSGMKLTQDEGKLSRDGKRLNRVGRRLRWVGRRLDLFCGRLGFVISFYENLQKVEKLYKHMLKHIHEIIPNFNIGISTGGEDERRWSDAYRHWRFVPRNHSVDESRFK